MVRGVHPVEVCIEPGLKTHVTLAERFVSEGLVNADGFADVSAVEECSDCPGNMFLRIDMEGTVVGRTVEFECRVGRSCRRYGWRVSWTKTLEVLGNFTTESRGCTGWSLQIFRDDPPYRHSQHLPVALKGRTIVSEQNWNAAWQLILSIVS